SNQRGVQSPESNGEWVGLSPATDGHGDRRERDGGGLRRAGHSASDRSARASAATVGLAADGRVSGARSQKASATSAVAPDIANAAPYPASSASAPATTGPMMAPRSATIWNPASTVPPLAQEPMTSATAAFVGGFTE